MIASGKLYWLASFYLTAFCVGWALVGGLLTYAGWGLELRLGMTLSLVGFGVPAYAVYGALANGSRESTLNLEAQRNKALASVLLGASIGVNVLINHVPDPHNTGHALAYALLSYVVASINASNIVVVYGYRTDRIHDKVLRFWYWMPAALSARYRREIRDSWESREDFSGGGE